MQIITISPRGFGANTYVLTKDGKNAIVIDPAQPRVKDELLQRGLQPQFILLTHCHFDHVGGVASVCELGAKVLCSESEKSLVGTSADLFDKFGAPRIGYAVDETFVSDEEKSLCGLQVRAIATPGHTLGSVCYLITDGDKRYLFSGDTLFAGTIGRTDFPTGNIGEMRKSLQKLAALDGDMPVYPGHEEETTLQQERLQNPFMVF